MSRIATGDSVEVVCARDALYASAENLPIFVRMVDEAVAAPSHRQEALFALFSYESRFMTIYDDVIYDNKVRAGDGRRQMRYIDARRLLRLLDRALGDVIFNSVDSTPDELEARAQKFLLASDEFTNANCDFKGYAEVEMALDDERNTPMVLQCGKCGRFMRLPVRVENAHALWD